MFYVRCVKLNNTFFRVFIKITYIWNYITFPIMYFWSNFVKSNLILSLIGSLMKETEIVVYGKVVYISS